MSDTLNEYRDLQKRLTWIRWTHLGHESEEEDEHLEKMDEVWWKLSDDERAIISSEPFRNDLIEPTKSQPEMIDVDVREQPGRVRQIAA